MALTNTISLVVNIFLLFVCVMQILANLIVLYVWLRTKRLFSNDNLILLISLALIDFVYACEQFPLLCILLAGWVPDGQPLNYDAATVIWVGGPSAALMKGGCTITTAIAIDRCFAVYFPVFYYRQSKRWWSIGSFSFAIFLVSIDWLVCIFTVPIRAHPGASNFGGFVSPGFRMWWGLSNMAMNLLSCLFTLVIIYHLCKRKKQMAELAKIEKANRGKIDRSANRVAFYILSVSALIGVVPGALNAVGLFIEFPLLQEISFFVGTCATLSGLSHAFIFAMAHRDIRLEIGKRFCGCFIPPQMMMAVPTRSNGDVSGAFTATVITTTTAGSRKPSLY